MWIRHEAEGILLEADDDGWVAWLTDARWCNCVVQRSCEGWTECESKGVESIVVVGGMPVLENY